MGKKSKAAPKEDKPKKETLKPGPSVKDILEGKQPTTSAKPVPPPRSGVSKKMDRGFDASKTACLEGFKWDSNEKFPHLPPMISTAAMGQGGPSLIERLGPVLSFLDEKEAESMTKLDGLVACTRGGWDSYLHWRLGAAFTKLDPTSPLHGLVKNKSLRDGLSSPMTLAGAYFSIVNKRVAGVTEDLYRALNDKSPLHFVVVGARAANEERLLKETAYWDELGLLFRGRRVHLYLTGTDLSGNYVKLRELKDCNLDMRVECWKGQTIDFFLERPRNRDRMAQFKTEDTVVVAYNLGVGTATFELCKTEKTKTNLVTNDVIWRWLPTCYFLAATDFPIVLTGSSESAGLVDGGRRVDMDIPGK